jgi:hypothetical protein
MRTRNLGSKPILDTPLGLVDHITVENEERINDHRVPDLTDQEDDTVNPYDPENPDDPDDPLHVPDNEPQDDVAYDDPRYDPREGGSSSNSFHFFEPKLFDPGGPYYSLRSERIIPIRTEDTNLQNMDDIERGAEELPLLSSITELSSKVFRSNLKPLKLRKKVGFKSFLTKFFTPD